MSSAQDSPAGASRPTVFLSYARTDREHAERLAAALGQAGIDVWWDALIEGGAEFAKSIEAAIARCDAVVVAWSRKAVESDWVLDEASGGRELHKLVPVSLDGTEPPMGFRRYHSVDLRHWLAGTDDQAIDKVVRGITSLTTRDGAGTAAADIRTGAPRSTSRRRLLIGAAGIVAASASGVLVWRSGYVQRRLVPSRGNSVAVLPFENLSGDAQQNYFSDGLAEEVRSTLARNIRLQVMAQTSSAKFRDGKDDATAIAEQLGVAYLLSGSVRRSGEVVRVAADLIDGQSGFSRWSQTFDRNMTDIFTVQSEIANTVADALAARVEADEQSTADAAAQERATSGGTTSVAAFDAYLRGRALYDLSVDEASERAALAQFDAAIAADPQYAAAHAARARSLTAIANQYGSVGTHGAMYDAAVAAAERAIELAPRLADAHSTLGFTLFQGRLDARAARAPFEQSLKLGSGEATVLARYSQYSARIGNDAAAAPAMKRALLLDPLNPLIHRAAGSIEYAARRYAGSIAPVRRALAMNPKMSRAHAAIGDAQLQLDRPEEARREYLAEPVDDFRLTGLAIVERRLGNADAARQSMDRLVNELADRVLYQQAQVLAQWGESEPALERLEQARKIGDTGLIYARNDPLLDPLRDSPRFRALLQGMGFA
ncbi:MAG TPA: TIR domain-containing protein [Steroidobacteraceae bacterium]